MTAVDIDMASVDEWDPDSPASDTPSNSPRDDAPLVCKECGTPLEYSGRGRKPSFCAEHKRSGSTATRTATPTKPRGTKAVQAMASLEATYDGLNAALMLVGLDNAANMFTVQRAVLSESNRRALESSPMLAEALARVGNTGGTFTFITAHLVVAIPLAIVARQEYVEKYPQGIMAAFGFGKKAVPVETVPVVAAPAEDPRLKPFQ